MRNRKERIYASKVDYLIDINETNDIFSGYYEIQTILFSVTIIFVIMLTAYNFRNIFGTEFLFSENINNCKQIYSQY